MSCELNKRTKGPQVTSKKPKNKAPHAPRPRSNPSAQRERVVAVPAPRFSITHLDNGVILFREPKAMNEFNRHGITLECTTRELRAGLGPDPIRDRFSAAFGMQLITATGLANDMPVNSRQDFIVTDEGLTIPLVAPGTASPGFLETGSLRPSDPTATDLVRPRDDALAKTIREWPILLLQSAVHQDALARWTFGVRFGGNQEVKDACKEFLARCQEPQIGRPSTFIGSPQQFKQAYDDLCEYGQGLRQCVEKVTKVADVTTYFPDMAILETLGIPITERVNHPKYMSFAPNLLADTWITHIIGLKRAATKALVRIARQEQASSPPLQTPRQ